MCSRFEHAACAHYVPCDRHARWVENPHCASKFTKFVLVSRIFGVTRSNTLYEFALTPR